MEVKQRKLLNKIPYSIRVGMFQVQQRPVVDFLADKYLQLQRKFQ